MRGVSVEKMCRVLGVSRSGYYAWLKSPERQSKGSRISDVVKQVFVKSKGTYRSPRITKQIRGMGIEVSRATVARVMKTAGLMARARRKFVHTTDSDHGDKVAANLLNREYQADRINQKWVSDITYIRTAKGWAYLTVIIDLADRMVVAWNLSKELSSERTTIKTLHIALERRKIDQPLLFHSDRGVQYAASTFRKALKKHRHITQSMSRTGNFWENVVSESFFKTLKTECTNRHKYRNLEEAKRAIFDYIERWYNTQRVPLKKHYLLTNRTVA